MHEREALSSLSPIILDLGNPVEYMYGMYA